LFENEQGEQEERGKKKKRRERKKKREWQMLLARCEMYVEYE
jgi:hypothetical protein